MLFKTLVKTTSKKRFTFHGRSQNICFKIYKGTLFLKKLILRNLLFGCSYPKVKGNFSNDQD